MRIRGLGKERGAAAPQTGEIAAMTATQMRWIECTAEQIADGRVLSHDGVRAVVSPRLPGSSVYNAVVYRDHDALRAAIDELESAYAAAGIQIWCVLGQPGDRDTAKLLKRRGHRMPGGAQAMVLDLDGLGERPPAMDLVPDPPAELAAEVNARAYGYPPGAFEPLFSGTPADMTVYVARVDGRAACTLQMIDVGEDSGLFGMATDPDFARRGLARSLLLHALHDARDRGRRISTLQASTDGEPLYRGLGYRPLGLVEMWERSAA
jgi:GNAT superfamily N-acetyltransferase